MCESNCLDNGRVEIRGTNLRGGRAILPSSKGSVVPWCLACVAPKLWSRPQSSRKPAGTHQCSLIPVLIALWEIWAGLGGGRAATGERLPAGLRRVREERVWTLPEGRGGGRCAPDLASQPRCQCRGPPGSCPAHQARKGLRALEYKQGQSYWERIWGGE